MTNIYIKLIENIAIYYFNYNTLFKTYATKDIIIHKIHEKSFSRFFLKTFYVNIVLL